MEDTSLKIGDKVLVPAGKENEECIATVVSVEEHTRLTVPFPLDKTKFIIAKYTEEEYIAYESNRELRQMPVR